LETTSTSSATLTSTPLPLGPVPDPDQPDPTTTTTLTPAEDEAPAGPRPPKQRRLVFADTDRPHEGSGYSLKVLDFDTGELHEIARNVSYYPSWSPDGSQLVSLPSGENFG